MAVVTIIDVADTADLTLPSNTWTSLVNGPITVTGTGGGVTMQGYLYNVDFSVITTRFVIDGTEQVELPSSPFLLLNKTLSVGSHTIDFQAISLNQDTTASTRGLVAFTL